MVTFQRLITLLAASVLMMFNTVSLAQESLCAVVKIEIKQELMLERQGFDAHMRISNALDTLTMENVAITVHFTDENNQTVLATSDTSSTEASFFIRVDSMAGIDDIGGAGVIQPASTVDVHWLIVPAPGSGGNLAEGNLYFVGATLSYTLGGKEEVTEVSPDFIRVKPMPLLSLDYFVTEDVVADDPFTGVIEPAELFTLGVRVRNNGKGLARNITIESAQPKIVENEQGLAIGFEIASSTINGVPAEPSLLINFGDIEPGGLAMGRWQMLTTLAGRFTEFSAEFTHADEFGGELTSLVTDTNTHLLIHDVHVDLPGRDGVTDFLAYGGTGVQLYESDGFDTEVIDHSSSASFNLDSEGGGDFIYALTFPSTLSGAYVKLPDPYFGMKEIHDVLRSDGKRLSVHNTWLSKKRNKDSNTWDHYINIFDVHSTGNYTVRLGGYRGGARAPVLQFVTDRTTHEGRQVSFIVEASDPDGTVPVLTAMPLPDGAQYADQGNGTAIFDWTPSIGQSGAYVISFISSDGVLKSSRTALIRVNLASDTDNDGLDDAWEIEHFGDLSRDGSGDYDGDGILDLDEFANGTDPAVRDVLGQPLLDIPMDQDEVMSRKPLLSIINSVRVDPASVSYKFEVFSDVAMVQLVSSSGLVPETLSSTAWQVDIPLEDNYEYYWRARAANSFGFSEWVNGRFFVNTVNDAPGPFQLTAPVDGITVPVFNPELVISNAGDVDRDVVSYVFRVYADENLVQLVRESGPVIAGVDGSSYWLVYPALEEDLYYNWQVTAVDSHGAETISDSRYFFVSTINEAPRGLSIRSPLSGDEILELSVELVINNASDAEGDLLNYGFELDRVNTFDSLERQVSNVIAEGVNTTTWLVSSLTDNSQYYWRAKASDGNVESEWVQGRFFVNVVNNLPPVPTISNPGNLAWVETLQPVLMTNSVVDIDGDSVRYHFELYDNSVLDVVVENHVDDEAHWSLITQLSDNSWYFWRVRSEDEHGAFSPWSMPSGFFVNDNGINDPPFISLIEPAVGTLGSSITIRWQDTDPDSSAVIALYYDTDDRDADGVLIVDSLNEDIDGDGDSYDWNFSMLPDGVYYLYAHISDMHSSITSYAKGPIYVGRPRGSITIVELDDFSEQDVCVAYEVALSMEPTSDVNVMFSSSVPEQGRVAPDRLTFRHDTWFDTEIIKVLGFNDCNISLEEGYELLIGALESEDLAFNGVDPSDILLGDKAEEPSGIGDSKPKKIDAGGGVVGPWFLFVALLFFLGQRLQGRDSIRVMHSNGRATVYKFSIKQ